MLAVGGPDSFVEGCSPVYHSTGGESVEPCGPPRRCPVGAVGHVGCLPGPRGYSRSLFLESLGLWRVSTLGGPNAVPVVLRPARAVPGTTMYNRTPHAEAESGSRLRVLHILAQLRASGAEVMLQVAAPYWRAAGVELHALETAEVPGHYGPQLEDAGYQVLRLPLGKGPADVRNLRDLIRSGRYDVVHIHREQADLICSLAARLAGAPAVVRTVHHIFPYRGRLRYRKMLERSLNRSLGTRYLCNSTSGSRNERQALRNPHRLVFNWYDDRLYRPPTRDERAEARRELGVEDDIAFVSIGGCAPYKNHDLILRALALSPGIRYLHVGPEPDDTERGLARALQVDDRVDFLGIVPAVRPVLYAADAFVMPSTIEGFGVAAIEAMASGVPTILSDQPALCDLKGRVPGMWVPLDVNALADAMRAMAERPEEERLEEGRRASHVVRGLFGAQRGAEGYLAAWKDALAASRAGGS
jgi:glycosyltransferase involved in cell wall biosynthesis